jgi:hypothetical protein
MRNIPDCLQKTHKIKLTQGAYLAQCQGNGQFVAFKNLGWINNATKVALEDLLLCNERHPRSLQVGNTQT